MELMIDDRNCAIDDWRLRKSVDLRPNIGSAIADGARASTADDLQSRVEAFADLSIKFAAGLPDTYLVRRMAGQFQDAATSVGANYRAARRAKSHADFVSKIGTVSEEADECCYWLGRLRNANIRSTTTDIEPLLTEADELARIFGASHRTAKQRS
jgi:four helix bundle protein